MKLRIRWPLALIAVLLVLVVLFATKNTTGLFGGSDGAASQAARKASAAQASATEPVAGRIVAIDETPPVPIARPATTANGPTGENGEPLTKGKAWQRMFVAQKIDATVLDLIASDDPNDWLRVATLHQLCQSGIDPAELQPGRAANLDALVGPVFRRVATNFAARCGELGQPGYLSRVTHLTSRAFEANAALATAPALTDAVLEKGISGEELRRLTALLADADVANLWLARNFRRLDATLANVPGLANTPREDLRIAAVVAFCMRGFDCGPESLLSLQLCVNTVGTSCSEGGVTTAVSQMPPDRAARINSAARGIESALSNAEPVGLGLRLRTGP